MSETDRITINRFLRNRFSMLAQPEPNEEQVNAIEKKVQLNREVGEKLRSLSEAGWEDLDSDSVEWLQEQLKK